MSVSSRFDQTLARYGLVLIAVLVIVSVGALGGAYVTYANPPVEEVTEQTNRQQVATSVLETALVTNGTELYPEGEQLRNMPAYFYAASPNLTLRARTAVPSDQDVVVSRRLVLTTRAAREGEVFYRNRRLLAAENSTVSDGVAWTNATANMSALRTAVATKQSAVGGVGTVTTVVQLNVSYQTNRYSGELGATAPVVFTEQAYWLSGELTASRTHSTPVTRRVRQPPNTTLAGGLAAAGLGLLVAAAALGFRYRSLDESAVETEVAHSRYDEWISNGQIPTKSEKEYIRTDSLVDLVDIAIDSNKRVIHDEEVDTYAVVEGDIVYYYTSGDAEVTDWFDV